jgi:hypothetical protein
MPEPSILQAAATVTVASAWFVAWRGVGSSAKALLEESTPPDRSVVTSNTPSGIKFLFDIAYDPFYAFILSRSRS